MNRVRVIFCVIIVCLVGYVLFSFAQGTAQTYQISYLDGNVTKVVQTGILNIQTGSFKTETISIPFSQKYSLLMIIPKQLAQNEAEVEFSYNGLKRVLKSDPIIQFYKSSGELEVKAKYKNSSLLASINVLLPKGFISSLDTNQKTVLTIELASLTDLNLNELQANELENKLAEKYSLVFTENAQMEKLQAENLQMKNQEVFQNQVLHFADYTTLLAQLTGVINSTREARIEILSPKEAQKRISTTPAKGNVKPQNNSPDTNRIIPANTLIENPPRKRVVSIESAWPEKIELGVTSLNPKNSVTEKITYPAELRNSADIGWSLTPPQIQLQKGTAYDNSIQGLRITITQGIDGTEPHLLTVEANYDELIKNNSTVPRTIDTNIYLNYFVTGYGPPIRLKININKPGVILTPVELNEAGDYVSKIKGWKEIIVQTKKADGTPLAPENIGKTAKSGIIEEYKKNKFTFLLILGGPSYIPIQSKVILNERNPANNPYGDNPPVLDSFYFGEMNDDNYPELAVGRIPLDDSKSIIKYFKIEKTFSQVPKKAMVMFPDNQVFTVPRVERTLMLSSYQYQIIDENSHFFVSNERIIPLYVNPSWNDFNQVLNAADWVQIYSHGSPNSFFNSKSSQAFCPKLDLNGTNHPIISGEACSTAAELGKTFISNGALIYVGEYFPEGLIPFSLFALGKNEGIGEMFKETFRITIPMYAVILYGDPSITFPVETPSIKLAGNKIFFSKIKPLFIFSEEGLKDINACLKKNKGTLVEKCFDWGGGLSLTKNDDNSLLVNPGRGTLRVDGKYAGPELKDIKKVNVLINGKTMPLGEPFKYGVSGSIMIFYQPDMLKFLYDNNVLEKGFSIEIE
ncbi:MAG: C25 family cysteine peptidase [Candidatus Diapherotrites archaeon]|nr:C25 family cysteine peptidase [Candidatus Diapherotrites archaeon]